MGRVFLMCCNYVLLYLERYFHYREVREIVNGKTFSHAFCRRAGFFRTGRSAFPSVRIVATYFYGRAAEAMGPPTGSFCVSRSKGSFGGGRLSEAGRRAFSLRKRRACASLPLSEESLRGDASFLSSPELERSALSLRTHCCGVFLRQSGGARLSEPVAGEGCGWWALPMRCRNAAVASSLPLHEKGAFLSGKAPLLSMESGRYMPRSRGRKSVMSGKSMMMSRASVAAPSMGSTGGVICSMVRLLIFAPT